MIMERRKAFQFHTPSSLLIAGPSGCGKTVFTTKLLLENGDLFQQTPKSIHYCYGSWQDGFQKLKKGGVKFHEGIPESEQLPRWFPGGGVLVLDDLMDEGDNDKRVLDLFTKHSHHRNITVLYLCQDLFPNGKFGDAFVKLDPALLELLETVLPRSVAVMNTLGCLLEQVAVLQEQFGREHRLAAPRRTRYQQTRRSVKSKRFAPFHDLEKWSGVSRRSVFYLNNLANGVLTAGMRFNRPNRVTLRLKQMGFFLARLLILAMALWAAALLGRPFFLAGADLFF